MKDKEFKYKQYLKWDKRMEEIFQILKEIPYVKLDKPFQNGWVVSIKLRPDVANRKDVAEILQVISIGYQEEYITKSLEEVKMVRQGKKSYSFFKRKKRENKSLIPPKKRLTEKQFNELSDNLKSYFYLDTFSYAHTKHQLKVYYINIPEYWLELKARQNMITHTRKKGGELEQEYDYLDKKCREYWLLSTGGYGKSYPMSKARTKTRSDIKKFMKGEIDDLYNDRTPLEYEY